MANGASFKAVESPFDWVQRSLASALGVSPRDIPIRRDQPITAASDADVARLAGILGSRYIRVEDAVTGNISYAIRGSAMVLEPKEARNREMAERAEITLTPLPAKLRALDLANGPCRLIAPELHGIVDAAIDAIDALRLELRGDASPAIVDGLFAELLGKGGWLEAVRKPLQDLADLPTVELERHLEIVEIVSDVIECLHHAWDCETKNPAGLGEQLEYVIRGAGHIGDQVRIIREGLAESGVGRCELQTALIQLRESETYHDEPGSDGPLPFAEVRDQISLDDLLRQAEDFAARGPGIAGHGKFYALTRLQRCADLLYRRFEQVDAPQIFDHLQIAGSARTEGIAALNRLKAIIRGFHARLSDRSPPGPPKVRGSSGTAPSAPPSETTPLK